jgi:hypothetical protein
MSTSDTRSLRADDVQSTEAVRHGAYVAIAAPGEARRIAASAAVPELVHRLGLQNEFDVTAGHPREAVAFLRRGDASAADLEDDRLLRADAVVHVASPAPGPVGEFCAEITRLLGPAIETRVVGGIVRPKIYTGIQMHNFAYAHQVVQQPGAVMPNAFLVPLSKTGDWWRKAWMERHTYFLPRFDDEGRMRHEGHALAAEPGISCLLRRTYKHPDEPAPAGSYDFLTYFECADEDVPTFHEVRGALRDVAKNPEWSFVREGPTWHGRRVASWGELFD